MSKLRCAQLRCAIILLCVIVFLLYLLLSHYYHPSEPIYSIQEFYVPALNKTTNYNYQTTIGLKLGMKNRSLLDGIHYDALNVTIYYGRNLNTPLGNVSVSGFYQGHKKKSHRIMTVMANGFSRETAMEEVCNGKTVFRVDLVTELRYRYLWRGFSEWQWMRVGGNVTVNKQGMKSERKSVKLLHYRDEHMATLCSQ